MKTKLLYSACAILATGFMACNNSGTGTNTPADSTTTTTTTTTTVHRYTGSFKPVSGTKYIDLKTQKEVTVHIDTTLGAIVNDETNQPMDMFVEPMTHDTINGVTGTIVNNFKPDSAAAPAQEQTVAVTDAPATPTADAGNVKYKQKGDKTKYKDKDVKVKEQNGVIKTKDR